MSASRSHERPLARASRAGDACHGIDESLRNSASAEAASTTNASTIAISGSRGVRSYHAESLPRAPASPDCCASISTNR